MRVARGPVLVVALIALAAVLWPARGSGATPAPDLRAAAAVAWPRSASLVISEVETGGASASDEFVEIANVGPVAVDLAGLELAAASSAGTTASRRAGWSATTVVEPGRHLLVANAAGIWASIADLTYTTGIAATGGTVVLRPAGGSPIDAVGWGDATNAFVEGAPAPAPAAGSSIERLPGGAAGNGTDTNDNAADLVIREVPGPQRLADAPTPSASPSPSLVPGDPTPTPAPADVPPTPDPSPSATPDPATPSPTPSAIPTLTPSPSPVATPSPTPTPAPTPTPTPSPSPTPTATPTPTPEPVAIPIADARRLADGTPAIVEGILTTDLGALDADHTGFIQDVTGGIALYLDAAASHVLSAGTVVRASGTVDTRYGLTVLRCTLTAVEARGSASLPVPATIATGAADVRYEGVRVEVSGRVTSAPSEVADGTSLEVDDGSGPVRVIVDPVVIAALPVVRGDDVVAVGPLGRRDSGGTAVFRVHAVLPGSVARPAPSPSPTVDPTPTPSPSPIPTPTPAPTPSPTPAPTQTPAPTATPAPSPTPGASSEPVTPIAVTLAESPGTRVHVHGVVTAVPGGLWSATLGTIQDAGAALVIRFRGDAAAPALDARIEVTGTLLRSGSRLVLRADEPWAASTADADELPDPEPIDPGHAIDVTTDARLATVSGTVVKGSVRRSGARVTFQVLTADGVRFGVTAPAIAALGSSPSAGDSVRVTGVGVPGTSGSTTAAGRIWLRRGDDLASLAAAAAGGSVASGGATSAPGAAGGGTASPTRSVAAAGSPASAGGPAGPGGSAAPVSAVQGRAGGSGVSAAGSPASATSGQPTATPPTVGARALAAAAAGSVVNVAGVVRGTGPVPASILVADATGIVRIRFDGAAASLAGTVDAGDAISATGTTARGADATVEVVVAEPGLVALLPATGGSMAGADVILAAEAEGDGVAGLLAAIGTGRPGAGMTGDPVPAPPPDGLPGLLAVLAIVGGLAGLTATLAVASRRRGGGRPDSAVARRLAALASPRRPARPATAPTAGVRADGPLAARLDARAGTGLSSPPTRAGTVRPW
jgi:hypothetical protein